MHFTIKITQAREIHVLFPADRWLNNIKVKTLKILNLMNFLIHFATHFSAVFSVQFGKNIVQSYNLQFCRNKNSSLYEKSRYGIQNKRIKMWL